MQHLTDIITTITPEADELTEALNVSDLAELDDWAVVAIVAMQAELTAALVSAGQQLRLTEPGPLDTVGLRGATRSFLDALDGRCLEAEVKAKRLYVVADTVAAHDARRREGQRAA